MQQVKTKEGRVFQAQRDHVDTEEPKMLAGRAALPIHPFLRKLTKQDRCFVCSAEGRFSKDCPTTGGEEKGASVKEVGKAREEREHILDGIGKNDPADAQQLRSQFRRNHWH